MRLAALALTLLVLTGCSRAGVPTAIAGQAASSLAASAAFHHGAKTPALQPAGKNTADAGVALDARLHALFQANFEALDLNHDGVISATDGNVPDVKFHHVFGSYDTNKDGQITLAEYYPPARAKELLVSVQARATVSALGVGGHVTLDKAQFMFDVYLQDRITDAAERMRAIQEAFVAADVNHTTILREPELEIALAMLEARAELRRLQHQLGASSAPDPTAPPLNLPPIPTADPVASAPITP